MTLSPVRPSAPHPVAGDGLASQLPDIDPAQTRDWIDSLRTLVAAQGAYRARFLLVKPLEEAQSLHVGVPPLQATDFVNTISTEHEPWFPGDEASNAASAASSGGTPLSW